MAAPQILVVDDEETIQHILKQLLERQGCEVRTTGSFENALPMLDRWEPEVALLDIILPGKNGLQLLAEIKRRYRDAEVLMMTSNSSADTALQAMRGDAYDYVKKPFNLKEVWGTVQRAIEKRGLTLRNREVMQQHERRTRELSTEVALPEQGTDPEPLHGILEHFLETVMHELDAARGSLMLVREADGHLEIAASRGITGIDVRSVRVPPGRGVAGRVAAGGEPWLVADVEADRRPEIGRYPGLSNSFLSAPIASGVAIAEHRVLGVINVTNRRTPRPFRPEDLAFVAGLSRQVAAAIEGARSSLRLQRAYESLKEAQEQLVFSERLKAIGQMAAGVGHDFNNALSVILNRTQFALDELDKSDRDPSRIRGHLETIMKTAFQGAEAIKRIQDYTRIRKDVVKVPVELNTVIREAIEIARPKWKEESEARGAQIEIEQHLAEVPPIAGNVYELTQVFDNLIFNAVEAMPRGGRLIFRTFVDGERVVAEVADTGVGMDEETRKHLFEPFFTTKEYGHGLGTSILYGIVTRHGGEVSVTSHLGQGTSFRIALPRTSGEPVALPGEARAATEFRPVRVLLVDDDTLVRETYEEALTAVGHEVAEVSSGAEALALCERRAFDVVVTDLSMAGMSGLELATRLKERDAALPVVLFSGWALEDESEEVRSAAVDFVLLKPCMVDDLLRTLQKAVRA